MDTRGIELPVRRQLDAYNARDIDAFMSCWADDCQYYEFPDRLVARGAAEIRERHVVRFKDPDLHGRLITRIVVDNVVVDQETVTRNFPDGPGEVDVIAIYQIENGKIAKAWFKMGTPRPRTAAAMSMRPGNETDVEAIRSLTREAYTKWIPIIGREPLPMKVDYADAIRHHRFDLIHAGGQLAGLIETVREDDVLLIVNVAVLPLFQGRGFGKRLLTIAEDLASSLGLTGMRLYTNKLFVANIRLYTALGYEVAREEALSGGIAVHMTKLIVKREDTVTSSGPGPAGT
jgi:GNAT superfamily N-acetyltransferase